MPIMTYYRSVCCGYKLNHTKPGKVICRNCLKEVREVKEYTKEADGYDIIPLEDYPYYRPPREELRQDKQEEDKESNRFKS